MDGRKGRVFAMSPLEPIHQLGGLKINAQANWATLGNIGKQIRNRLLLTVNGSFEFQHIYHELTVLFKRVD